MDCVGRFPIRLLLPANTYNDSQTRSYCDDHTLSESHAPPTITPTLALPSHGPYLLITSDHSSFTLLGPEGNGAKNFILPDQGIIPYSLESAVSPDGEWLAYHTGSHKQPPYDLTMHIYSILDGESRTVAALISPDFPENQEQIIEFMNETQPEMAVEMGWTSPVIWSLTDGRRSLAWSPDGRYLAFAAQIDGPSSDLYLYDVVDETISRVSDEFFNIYAVEWSPDGSWIVFRDRTPQHTYEGGTIYAVDFRDGKIGKIEVVDNGFWSRGIGWLTEDLYVIGTSGSSGPGPHTLRMQNLTTHRNTQICPYASYSIFFDQLQERAIYSCDSSDFESDPSSPFHEQGLYYAYLDGRTGLLIDELFFDLAFQEGAQPRLVSTTQSGLVSISMEGNTATIFMPDKQTQGEFWREEIAVSPDQRWLALYGQYGFILFDENDAVRFQIMDTSISRVIWRPDSLGVFIYTIIQAEKTVYYYSIPDETLNLVEVCNRRRCAVYQTDFVWLP